VGWQRVSTRQLDTAAVAATVLVTGYLAAQYGLRPEPFLLGLGYAALGLGLSSFRRTRGRHCLRLPTLLAAVGDIAHPIWRTRALGGLSTWRDAGFAAGALLSGLVADAYGIPAAIWVIAGLTAASGTFVAIRMYETNEARP
jgi:hypothetical protein